jgi:hypothetical protein
MTFQNKAQNHFSNLKRNQIQHKDATIISVMGKKTIPNPKLSSLFLSGKGEKEKFIMNPKILVQRKRAQKCLISRHIIH